MGFWDFLGGKGSSIEGFFYVWLVGRVGFVGFGVFVWLFGVGFVVYLVLDVGLGIIMVLRVFVYF